MLLFHRPFTGPDEDFPPFKLSDGGMDPVVAKQLIFSKYSHGYESVDCSDLEDDEIFYSALTELLEEVGSQVYELLAAEFSLSVGIGDEHPLMHLESRVSGTHVYPMVQKLLENFYDELEVVLRAIHDRADLIRGTVRMEDID